MNPSRDEILAAAAAGQPIAKRGWLVIMAAPAGQPEWVQLMTLGEAGGYRFYVDAPQEGLMLNRITPDAVYLATVVWPEIQRIVGADPLTCWCIPLPHTP